MHPSGGVEHGELIRVVSRSRAQQGGHQRRLAAAAPTGEDDRLPAPFHHAGVHEDPRRRDRWRCETPGESAAGRVASRVEIASARRAEIPRRVARRSSPLAGRARAKGEQVVHLGRGRGLPHRRQIRRQLIQDRRVVDAHAETHTAADEATPPAQGSASSFAIRASRCPRRGTAAGKGPGCAPPPRRLDRAYEDERGRTPRVCVTVHSPARISSTRREGRPAPPCQRRF